MKARERPAVVAGDDPAVAWRRYSPRALTDGEVWTAGELMALRRGRYRPVAWAVFVRRSLARSGESRRARPEMARQARRWGAAGALAWIGAGAGTRDRAGLELRLGPGLLWWLAVWRMLDWHLGMVEGGDGRPRARLGPADAITLSRFWLVPATTGARRSARGPPVIIVVGGLTDWLDGRVARRSGRTRLGRDLDTTADLAFVLAATITARRGGRLSSAAVVMLAARYTLGVGIAAGAVFARARRPAIRARPWGAALRFSGLAIGAAGHTRTATTLVIAGSIVPPRSTSRHLPPA